MKDQGQAGGQGKGRKAPAIDKTPIRVERLLAPIGPAKIQKIISKSAGLTLAWRQGLNTGTRVKDIRKTDVKGIAEEIMGIPECPLRTSSTLMLGVTVLHEMKAEVLVGDCLRDVERVRQRSEEAGLARTEGEGQEEGVEGSPGGREGRRPADAAVQELWNAERRAREVGPPGSDFDFEEWAAGRYEAVAVPPAGTPHRPEQVDDFGGAFDFDFTEAPSPGTEAPSPGTEARPAGRREVEQDQWGGLLPDGGGGGGDDWGGGGGGGGSEDGEGRELIDWSHAPPPPSDWWDDQWNGWEVPRATVRDEVGKGPWKVPRMSKLLRDKGKREVGTRHLVFPDQLELTKRWSEARQAKGGEAWDAVAKVHRDARHEAGEWTDGVPEVREWADDQPPPPEWSGGGEMSGGGGFGDLGNWEGDDVPLPDVPPLPREEGEARQEERTALRVDDGEGDATDIWPEVVRALGDEFEFELGTVFGGSRRTLSIAFRRAITLHNKGWISLVQEGKARAVTPKRRKKRGALDPDEYAPTPAAPDPDPDPPLRVQRGPSFPAEATDVPAAPVAAELEGPSEGG
jgi:hypothetical protein